MKLQRQQFLLNYFKALSGGLAGIRTPNLPQDSRAPYQIGLSGRKNKRERQNKRNQPAKPGWLTPYKKPALK